MAEETEPVKKRRGWPKGKPRGPRSVPAPTPMFTAAPEPEAPIHVRLRLKNYPEPIEFGCAERTIENGFHVFTYPSERDRYRTTRREFAISEIIEIEITASRQQVQIAGTMTSLGPATVWTDIPESAAPIAGPPKIHSARESAMGMLERLATAKGSIKMDEMPNLTFGDHAG